jgi:hypothetical protein
MARSSLVFNSDDRSDDHIAYLTKSTFKPPKEVVTITSGPVSAKPPEPPSKSLTKRQQKEQEVGEASEGSPRKGKSGARRTKERDSSDAEDEEKKTAQELAAKLVLDLEVMREENEKHISKNRRLETKLQILKAQQDEHMVHRGRLIKACLYTAPVFLLCGGIDVFLATILLVWVYVEVESYLDGNEGKDEEEGDSDDEGGSDADESFGDHESFGDDGSMAL